MTASADGSVVAAGYYEGLSSITQAIRLSQPRAYSFTDDYLRQHRTEAAFYAARHGVAHIRADAYLARIYHEAERTASQLRFSGPFEKDI